MKFLFDEIAREIKLCRGTDDDSTGIFFFFFLSLFFKDFETLVLRRKEILTVMPYRFRLN